MTIARLGRIGGVVALGALAIPLASGNAAADTTSWVPTDTGVEAVSTATQLTLGGPVASTTRVPVVVSLPMQDRAALVAAVAAHRTIPHATLEAEADPSTATVAAVTSYLQAQGFTEIAPSADGLLVSATGTATQVDAAFDTTLDTVTSTATATAGATYLTNTTPAMVPASLAGDVLAVLGLTTIPNVHLDSAIAAPASSCDTYTMLSGGLLCNFEPADLQTIYDASTVTPASNTRIAIFGEGDLDQVIQDYHQAKASTGLPDSPVNLIVANGDTSSTDTSGADEFDLDTQLSTGLAQSVPELDLYDASSLDDGPLAMDFDAFQSADQDVAGSASFGGCESFAALDGSNTTDDQYFLMAAAQGQTVFASSGDTGASCLGPANGVSAGVPGVEYPASSTYVIGVGGTSLYPGSDAAPYTYQSEMAWQGSGGGVSAFEAAPSYQLGKIGTYALGDQVATQTGDKTVPDISNDADPNQGGAWVDVDGAYEGVGGTSLASPMTLGEWARLETYYGNSLGFAGPVLYGLAGSDAIHDVTSGANAGGFPATVGYDEATGIGTLDVANAITQISALGLDTSSGPTAATPETPWAAGPPVAGLAAGGLAVRRIRRRRTA